MKTFLKPLNAEEEKYYLEKMKEGSLEAKNTLIERNLRLVAHISRKYQNGEEDMEDLISIGTIGLIKGVSTFKADKNVRLATYASRCIENTIHSQRLKRPLMWAIVHTLAKNGVRSATHRTA